MRITTEQVNPKDIKIGDTIWIDGRPAKVILAHAYTNHEDYQYIKFEVTNSGHISNRPFKITEPITKLVLTPPAQEPKNTKTYSLSAGLGKVEIDTKTLDSLEVGMYASWFDGQRQVTLTIERADFVTPRSRSAEDEIRLAAAVVADSYNLTIEEMEVLQTVLTVRTPNFLESDSKWHLDRVYQKTGARSTFSLLELAQRKLEDYDCEVIRV